MNAQDVIRLLGDISGSAAPSTELERQLASIPMRDLYQWTYSETKEVERMLGEARRNIGRRRSAEKASAKRGAK